MHARLVLLCLLLLTACGGEAPDKPGQGPAPVPLADFGANPAPIEALQAPVLFTPPAGTWRHRSEDLAPGQHFEQFLSEGGDTLLRLFIFPVRGARDPSTVLLPAVDTFFRGIGVHGFGLPTRRPLRLWGAPAAEGSLNAVINMKKVVGEVRLLLVDPETWALAIGYGAADAKATVGDTIHRFVTSLEPRDPQFYSPAFRAQEELDRVVVKPENAEPITMAQVAAVELVLEAGVGARFPLSSRRYVREALTKDVQLAPARTHTAYREAASALRESESLAPEERERGMRALGKRVLKALLNRVVEGYEPAVQHAAIWKRLRTTAVGPAKEGLTVGDLVCLNESSSFLASLAANRPVQMNDDVGLVLRDGLAARWDKLASGEQQALRDMGATWAALRRAWDLAIPDARFAFRRAVMARLASMDRRAAIEALGDSRALMESGLEPEADVVVADLLRRAFELTSAERAALMALLDVEPKAHQLGW